MTQPNDRDGTHELMRLVAEAIEKRRLPLRQAAEAIGVGLPTLQRHLAGEHVRSDSVAKYRSWLQGRTGPRKVFALFPDEQVEMSVVPTADLPLPPPPSSPHLVVDVFSGCGGLSLGFDLLDDGRWFRTVLALDNQAAPVAVMNENLRKLGHTGAEAARQVDLTEFLNEAEVLAFYLEHVSGVQGAPSVMQRLHAMCDGAFSCFRSRITTIDRSFVEALRKARGSATFLRGYSTLDRQCLQQTSVLGFHEALKLPPTGTRDPRLPSILWASELGNAGGSLAIGLVTPADLVQKAEAEWDLAVTRLSARTSSSGRGQLTSSARRITTFVSFLQSAAMREVRKAWCDWRAARSALRADLFGDERFAAEVEALYHSTFPVSVLLGGPPCQGFSRIGRGKIRSLREASVHVHGDDDAVDARNLLFQQYLLFVSALRPATFLFENVQHFQSVVRSGSREFSATEVLAEAIRELSSGRVAYSVSSRTLDASRHGIPQTRQRFFMCGTLDQNSGGSAGAKRTEFAERCLQLPSSGEVPLAAALAGLPDPRMAGGDATKRGGMSDECPVGEVNGSGSQAALTFLRWVRQPRPDGSVPTTVDSHVARAPRLDDAEFFSLLGPGKRWMDYRSGESETLSDIRLALTALGSTDDKSLANLGYAGGRPALKELLSRIDGSLPLRMLLEQIGARMDSHHHLLSETYLAKRDGNHGDWLARLDATRPCKTIVAHMGKDSYGYVHPFSPRTLSAREAARVQSFPDWFSFAGQALTDTFRMIGNAVPPLLGNMLATRIAATLALQEQPAARHRTGRVAR
ncbi:DNA cytosine methyltransferase [Methylobacterium sp. Leaf469]|uniref:DNA cytosine methyltransferase n=1 Tax=Methylobacterium sp. Leaf469 TaxID=1736387 RepID=UPI000A911074|nr:DNA cytosine methyltransferase [Methylobacterium sp. Leaf469]